MTEEELPSGEMEKSRSSEYHSDDPIIKDSSSQNGRDRRSPNVDRKGILVHAILQRIGRLIPSFVFRVKAVYILWLPRER